MELNCDEFVEGVLRQKKKKLLSIVEKYKYFLYFIKIYMVFYGCVKKNYIQYFMVFTCFQFTVNF